MGAYQEFLSRKITRHSGDGINPSAMPAWMKPHQADATAFALRTGRAGNFLDTGLGKTACELEFAQVPTSHKRRPQPSAPRQIGTAKAEPRVASEYELAMAKRTNDRFLDALKREVRV